MALVVGGDSTFARLLRSRLNVALCRSVLDVPAALQFASNVELRASFERAKRVRCQQQSDVHDQDDDNTGDIDNYNNNDNNNDSNDCDDGFNFNGRCYCNQDGRGGGSFGATCRSRFVNGRHSDDEDSDDHHATNASTANPCGTDDTKGGVPVHGGCRCFRGFAGVDCRNRCVELRALDACRTLNGRLVRADAHDEFVAHIETAAQLLPPSTALRDALCREAARRFLCHADNDANDDDDDDNDDSVRVAFVLMVHNTRHTWNGTALADREPSSGLQLVRWLLDALWDRRHLFVVHVDARAPRAWQLDLRVALLSDARYADNVLLLPRQRRVVWSSIDVVDAALSAMRFALAHRKRWDVLINLSGADIALKTPLELKRYLFPRRHFNMVIL